jgi:hypothetical protein
MATSIFDSVCNELQRTTGLERLVMRGTVRLALRSVGLDPATLTKEQFELVARQVLPEELTKRGIANGASVCAGVLGRIAGAHAATAEGPESPDDIFRRLGAR